MRRQDELPVTVLRLAAIYGPEDPYNRLYPYVRRMDDGRPAILLDERIADWRWSRQHVDNVAAAIALAVRDDRSAGRVYNVGPRQTLSEAEWVTAIGRTIGWNGDLVLVPPDLLPESMRWEVDTRQHIEMDSARIRSELGYEAPIPLEAALAETIAWSRAHPPPELELDYAAEDRVLAAIVAP